MRKSPKQLALDVVFASAVTLAAVAGAPATMFSQQPEPPKGLPSVPANLRILPPALPVDLELLPSPSQTEEERAVTWTKAAAAAKGMTAEERDIARQEWILARYCGDKEFFLAFMPDGNGGINKEVMRRKPTPEVCEIPRRPATPYDPAP